MNVEIWTHGADDTSATVTGRVPIPWWWKFNVIWWFGNDNEPWPPDWYRQFVPNRPYWLQVVSWYIRNPLENFSNWVLGVADRNYTVYGQAPVMLTAWNDLPEPYPLGFKYSVIHLGWLRLPFVSYVGKRIMFYIGWQAGGFAGAKFNLLHTKTQLF